MSEKTKVVNPADLHLPRDYEDDLEYRLPPPIIHSTDTSDDEDKNRSGETIPINNTIPDKPIPPNPFVLLTNLVDMANQGTGGNAQQLGNGTNSIPLAQTLLMLLTNSQILPLMQTRQVIWHQMTLSRNIRN
jgi:hypothetical protein